MRLSVLTLFSLFLISILNLIGCGANNQPKVVTLPELINKDSKVREFRYRRFDCLHLNETSNAEECSQAEEITETLATSSNSTITVNETTPWKTEKSRTIVNPTLQRNSTLNTILVKAYLRFFDLKNKAEKNILYEFEGNLNDLPKNVESKKIIKLTLKPNEHDEKVNASAFCIDNVKCNEVILTFAFTNYNLSGQKFIDSRHFQIDDREIEPKESDYIPGKATQTISELVRVEELKNHDITIDQDHADEAFIDIPKGPVLPKEEGEFLCEGLIKDNMFCPAYLIDSNLPKPSIHERELKLNKVDISFDETKQTLLPEEESVLFKDLYGKINQEILTNALNKGLKSVHVTPNLILKSNTKDLSPVLPKSSGLKEGNNKEIEKISFTSIDQKFEYDLAICLEHLEKTKQKNYHQANGFYSKGSLQDASHYSETDYITNSISFERSKNQYSSEMTKQIIEFSGCVLKQRYENKLHTNINDLSKEKGGKLKGHRSHQNGLDADISYPHLNNKTDRFDNFVSNMTLDRLIAALDMARIMIYTDRIATLFTDDRIRKKFCDYLKSQNLLKEYRPLVEDYMYHVKGHHNHYHIRVKCNSQNEGCTTQGILKKDKICD